MKHLEHMYFIDSRNKCARSGNFNAKILPSVHILKLAANTSFIFMTIYCKKYEYCLGMLQHVMRRMEKNNLICFRI